MIKLTRLNGEQFTLNACMIEQIQSYPDTTITLLNGKKLVVKEEEIEVVERVSTYYQKIGWMRMIQEAGDQDE